MQYSVLSRTIFVCSAIFLYFVTISFHTTPVRTTIVFVTHNIGRPICVHTVNTVAINFSADRHGTTRVYAGDRRARQENTHMGEKNWHPNNDDGW